jgi:hypothetical protein
LTSSFHATLRQTLRMLCSHSRSNCTYIRQHTKHEGSIAAYIYLNVYIYIYVYIYIISICSHSRSNCTYIRQHTPAWDNEGSIAMYISMIVQYGLTALIYPSLLYVESHLFWTLRMRIFHFSVCESSTLMFVNPPLSCMWNLNYPSLFCMWDLIYPSLSCMLILPLFCSVESYLFFTLLYIYNYIYIFIYVCESLCLTFSPRKRLIVSHALTSRSAFCICKITYTERGSCKT